MNIYICVYTLHWRQNDHDDVSNHQPRGCLLNRLFRCRSKKTAKLRVTGLCVGKSPGPVNSPHKGPVTRKMFPFDDVIMSRICITWSNITRYCLQPIKTETEYKLECVLQTDTPWLAREGELYGVCWEDFGNKWPLYNGGALYFLQILIFYMMTSSKENIFRVTCPLWGESFSHRWIPFTKANDADFLCFLWSAPEQMVEQTIEMPVIWDVIALIMTLLKCMIDDLCGYKYILLIRFV